LRHRRPNSVRSGISFRDAKEEDFEFLFALHRSTMREYVAATWGSWDERDQRRRFGSPREARDGLRIIRFEGVDVGALRCRQRGVDTFLVSIEVLPKYQSKGIGSVVIEDLIEAGSRAGGGVELTVLKANERARRLYERLGFVTTSENDERHFMRIERTRS